jgi:hypothetical protein
MVVAILGWGSLIWDDPPSFTEWHDNWQSGGPAVRLEFSRVSKSRHGALTLVIDEANGEPCTVNYAMSKRKYLVDAVADLRCREGCNWGRISCMENPAALSKALLPAEQAIKMWAENKGIDAVVWTALKSNFRSHVGSPFTVDNAKAYLKGLTPEGKVRAAEYMWRAPNFVDTPLRRAVQIAPWF